MKLAPIVQKLRAQNITQFGNQIAGAADLASVMGDVTKIPVNTNVAYVIKLSEEVKRNQQDTGINQVITENFGVVCILTVAVAQEDKTGLTASNTLNSIRTAIFSAILGWQLPAADYPNIESLISYAGAEMLHIDSAHLWYMYKFSVDSRIDDDDGVDEDINLLPTLDQVFAQYTDNIDAITLSGVAPKLTVNQTPTDDITMEQSVED